MIFGCFPLAFKNFFIISKHIKFGRCCTRHKNSFVYRFHIRLILNVSYSYPPTETPSINNVMYKTIFISLSPFFLTIKMKYNTKWLPFKNFEMLLLWQSWERGEFSTISKYSLLNWKLTIQFWNFSFHPVNVMGPSENFCWTLIKFKIQNIFCSQISSPRYVNLYIYNSNGNWKNSEI